MFPADEQSRKQARQRKAGPLSAFDNDPVITALRRECREQNVLLIERLNGHFQLEETYLINYWPLSANRTIYSRQGSIGTIYNVTPQEAVMLAIGVSLPPNGDR